MNKTYKIIGGAVVAVLLVIGGWFAHGNHTSVLVGGAAGQGEPAGFDNVSLTGGLKVGVAVGDVSVPSYGIGSSYTTSIDVNGGYELLNATGTAYQLAASDMIHTVIGFIATTSTTVTLPATSTLTAFLPNVGDSMQMFFVNASSTGGTITLAGNTGVTLQVATSSKAIIASAVSILYFIRTATGSINVLMDINN